MICLEILLYYECSTVSNTFNVYQALNFRTILKELIIGFSQVLCNLFYAASTPETWNLKLYL